MMQVSDQPTTSFFKGKLLHNLNEEVEDKRLDQLKMWK
jgi:hypothetical protein